MSFNIRYGDAPDGANAWPFRRDAAMAVIRRFQPHVLSVQEAVEFQNEELLSAFPELALVGVGRDDGASEGEFASIFYDQSCLGLVDSGTFWFSDRPSEPGSRHPECFHPRICTWAAFTQGFAVYNLHLDNVSTESREMAVDQLLETIKSDYATVITGDFNAGESDRCIEKLRLAGYRDSYRVLHAKEANVGTYHGFGSAPEPDKIDYIWVNSSWTVLESGIVRDQIDSRWSSDHYPVTATITRNP